MKLQVDASPPRTDDGERLKHEFDPGATSWSIHFSFGLSVSPFLPGFAFLRLYEEAALPMRTGRVNVFADAGASTQPDGSNLSGRSIHQPACSERGRPRLSPIGSHA